MSLSAKEYLQHILEETQYLRQVTENLTKEGFLADVTLKRAFIYSVAIIGEAAKHIPQEIRDLRPDTDWRGVGRMRDKLIHAYFGINYNILWDTIKNDVPNLEKQLQRFWQNCHEKSHRITVALSSGQAPLFR